MDFTQEIIFTSLGLFAIISGFISMKFPKVFINFPSPGFYATSKGTKFFWTLNQAAKYEGKKDATGYEKYSGKFNIIVGIFFLYLGIGGFFLKIFQMK